MTASKKLDELTELAILLQNTFCGYTLDEISEKLERPRRTTERLMEILKDKFGDRLETVPHHGDRKKYWRLKKGTMNFLISFKDTEIAKLEMLKNEIKNENEKQLITEIIEKIKALNPKTSQQTDIDTLLEAQGFAVRQHPKENPNEDFIKKIEYSILALCKLKIKYKDSYGNIYEPVVEPYGIEIAENHYLIAKEGIQTKTFKISRIQNIEVLENDYFDKDDSFDIQDYCARSFGVYQGKVFEVVLKFSSEASEDILNYNFHPSQTIKEQKDGSVLVRFRASGIYEIITELLKWRSSVTILEPLTLKEEYKKTVESMYKNL